ncbi:MAG: TIGR01777 family oxidoreductase [Ignavibacteriales bacterium]|nr:TIGR01777 family oxidoreductase [Ignavibacteriales bacterium]
MKKVLLTGATGLIGKSIAAKLIQRGDEVTIFTRSVNKAKTIIPIAAEYVAWNLERDDWQVKLEGKDAVIHLAGESVMAKRWNNEHKKNIYNSRIDSTRILIEAIGKTVDKPKVFISASAIGYYGNSDEPVTEKSNPGKDFLANVVRDWEKETEEVERLRVRKVNIRIGIVLDKHEGALARMITPYKFFIGGPLGSGRQWFPWIHINDVAGIFLFALDNENVRGVLNAVSPNPLRMNEFCKTLGGVMHRPSLFKVPAFVLKIIFGEAAEVLLGGAKVIPKRTIELGYIFNFVKAEDALKNLLKK